ncbi:MAG TPA: hypothetical protein VNH64_11135 [Parvularculaceae bacterium]|nr:hypothetical protein [Parvularculaceae bacterium]
MIRLLAFSAFAVVFSAGAAVAARPDAAATLAKFENTGNTESCLNVRTISSITPLSDTEFLVRVGTSRYYLNETHGKCIGAASAFSRLQYTTTTGMLCSNQVVDVVDNSTGFTSGACALGDFQELRKK